jgi:hypothetical protein
MNEQSDQFPDIKVTVIRNFGPGKEGAAEFTKLQERLVSYGICTDIGHIATSQLLDEAVKEAGSDPGKLLRRANLLLTGNMFSNDNNGGSAIDAMRKIRGKRLADVIPSGRIVTMERPGIVMAGSVPNASSRFLSWVGYLNITSSTSDINNVYVLRQASRTLAASIRPETQ